MRVTEKTIHAVTGIEALKKLKKIILITPKTNAQRAIDLYPSLCIFIKIYCTTNIYECRHRSDHYLSHKEKNIYPYKGNCN